MNVTMNDTILVGNSNSLEQFSKVVFADPLIKSTMLSHEFLKVAKGNKLVNKVCNSRLDLLTCYGFSHHSIADIVWWSKKVLVGQLVRSVALTTDHVVDQLERPLVLDRKDFESEVSSLIKGQISLVLQSSCKVLCKDSMVLQILNIINVDRVH